MLKTRRPSRRVLAAIAVGSAALVVAVLVVRYAFVLDDARALRDDVRLMAAEVRELGPDLDAHGLGALESRARTIVERERRLADVVAGDLLIGFARALPVVGEQVRAGDSLMAAASDLVAVLDEAIGIAGEYVTIRAESRSGADTFARLAHLAHRRQGALERAREQVDLALDRLAQIPDGVLPAIRSARDEVQAQLLEYRPALDSAFDAATIGTTMVGIEGPRRYLVVLQDPAELRPTGGYVGSYGLLTFDRGRLVDKAFRDILTLDNRPGLPYLAPPAPLRDHLLGDRSWRLADANWWPDGPTSAREIARLYALESGGDAIDGIIFLTTYAIDELLRLTGPVDVPSYDTRIVPGDATLGILAATRSPLAPLGDRKAFLGAFADAFLDRLFALPPSRWTELPPILERIRTERHAALWLVAEDAQARIAQAGWAGAVPAPGGDEVLLVESNVGPVSKLHLVTERTVQVEVAIDEAGRAFGALVVTWTNRIRDDTADPWVQNASEVLLGYQLRDVLGVFVRVLTPPGSSLQEVVLSGDGVRRGGLESVGVELGRTSFGAYAMVPPGRTELRYGWVTPAVTEIVGSRRRYTLSLPKQAGRLADPLELRIELPDGARMVDVEVVGATPALDEPGIIRASGPWRTDVQVAVTYEMPSPGGP